MTIHRRDILAAGGGLVCAATLDFSLPGISLPGSRHRLSLLLYSQGLHLDALALRSGAAPGGWIEQPVCVLRHDGFTATSMLLERSAPCRVVALLNDADGLVIDRMLARRGVRDLTMRRANGTAFLLTATLQTNPGENDGG